MLGRLNLCLFFLSLYTRSNSDPIPTTPPAANITTEQEEEILGETRRILKGREITDTRPYMVFLRPTRSHSYTADQEWLCGGVIIHESYILTSAACIEDIKYFYVVSGTHRWLPGSETNECMSNGQLRAIWKCVSRTYRFDGHVFNNIRWMVNDIAVVMVEGAISFSKRVKGCDFIPQRIDYNNLTIELEKPGTKGSIAGWGSTDKYTDAADILARTSVNSPNLLETQTTIITKDSCKKQWLSRYSAIIDNYMICGKVARSKQMSKACNENQVECRQLLFSEEEGPRIRRFESNPDKLLLESAATIRKRESVKKHTRRSRVLADKNDFVGGFCENDHGGPFIVGQGHSAIVVGIMSAYRVENNSKQCYGPFLYTSVYNNRHLIHCALHKTEENDCGTVMRDQSSVIEEETFDWSDMPFRQRTIYEDDDPVPEPDNGAVAITGHTDTSIRNTQDQT